MGDKVRTFALDGWWLVSHVRADLDSFGFGLTACCSHLGLAFGPLLAPLRDFLSRAEHSESVSANG